MLSVGYVFDAGGTGNGTGSGGSDGYTMGPRRPNLTLNHPDAQQLFVGNIPYSLGEEQLKEFFEGYGHVLELRVNRKPGSLGDRGGRGGGYSDRTTPNYGFVVFEDAEVVKTILQKKVRTTKISCSCRFDRPLLDFFHALAAYFLSLKHSVLMKSVLRAMA